MMDGNHGFMGGYMWIFWIAVIVGIFFLLKWIIQQSSPKLLCIELDSLEILKRRYAQGEIDKEEFEQRKKDLLP